jgi:hypothetical protein
LERVRLLLLELICESSKTLLLRLLCNLACGKLLLCPLECCGLACQPKVPVLLRAGQPELPLLRPQGAELRACAKTKLSLRSPQGTKLRACAKAKLPLLRSQGAKLRTCTKTELPLRRT